MANYLLPLSSESRWCFPAEGCLLAGVKMIKRNCCGIVLAGDMVKTLYSANSICCNTWDGTDERKYRAVWVRSWDWCYLSMHCSVLLPPATHGKSGTWEDTLISWSQEGICWCTRHAEKSKSFLSALNDTGELMQLLGIGHLEEWEAEESCLSEHQSLHLALSCCKMVRNKSF